VISLTFKINSENLKKIKEKYQKYDVGVTTNSLQQNTLMSLVQICYQFFMPQAQSAGGLSASKNTTTFYGTVRTIALRLAEYEIAEELDELYEKTKVNEKKTYPLPVLQYVFNRDARLGYSPEKAYDGRTVTLMQIITALDRAELRIKDLFTQLCILHDIDVSVQVNRPHLGGEEEMNEL
jgi:hypothetical protein